LSRDLADTEMRRRALAAEARLADALELIAELQEQVDRANRAAVRMARRLGVAAPRRRAAA
jgi:hypothetical protein